MLNQKAKRTKMSRLISAPRLMMVLLLSLGIGFTGCDSQKGKGSVKEPVVTKQIGKSAKSIPVSKEKDTASVKKPDSPVISEAVAETQSTKPKRMPYNPVGRIDPFAPLYKEDKEKVPQQVVARPKVPERPRTPLEKLDLGQLKLTAIVTTQGFKKALVEEASGKGYVVSLGTKIGLERGSVVEIAQDRIIIEHKDEDEFGKENSKKRELKLQKPPGE
ncbi:MAG: pilus assembly protein PilP [Desulfobacterales bacterium]